MNWSPSVATPGEGSIGYLSYCGNMDTSITIRTLTALTDKLYCSAGGGIVADSEEAAEYQETLIKLIVSCSNWRS